LSNRCFIAPVPLAAASSRNKNIRLSKEESLARREKPSKKQIFGGLIEGSDRNSFSKQHPRGERFGFEINEGQVGKKHTFICVESQ
jgi:hypothetical protein